MYRGHQQVINDIDISMNDQYIISCAKLNELIYIWDINTSQPLCALRHPKNTNPMNVKFIKQPITKKRI